jgi:PLP dependent protein
MPAERPARSFRLPTRLESNLRALRGRIAQAASQARRRPEEVELVAVTKTVPAAQAEQLARLGQLDLGENRVQELWEKSRELADRGVAARWHFVGHLQRNKARRALQVAAVVHSVDSLDLLETLERIAAEEGRRPQVYLEVKLAPAAARSGFDPSDVEAAVERARGLEHLELVGLMGMGPLPACETARDYERSRAAFQRLRDLRERLPAEAFAAGRAKLSMGMSSDLEAAIAAGSDVVRVGSALFAGDSADESAPSRRQEQP